MKTSFKNIIGRSIRFNLSTTKLIGALFFIAFNANLTSAASLVSKNDFQVDSARKRLIVKYYSNGKISEKGYQGYYADKDISTGTYIGTWSYYDTNGNLEQSIYYYNDIPSKAFIQKKKYYPNGKIKSIEIFNNYELYQSEIDSLGKWKYFDSKGKLIKEIVH